MVLINVRMVSAHSGIRSWSFGSSSNLMRTALMASGSGMLVNSAETSYAIIFYPGGTYRFLTLPTKSPLFWMWRSDLPTRGQYVRLPRLATIVSRGTFTLWILGRPYILGISSGIDKMFEKSRGWALLCHRRIISVSSLLNFGVGSFCNTS